MIDYENSASKKLLDRLHEHKATVRFVCNRLLTVVEILEEVNMDRQAERIFACVEELQFSTQSLDSAYDDNLDERLRESQAFTGSILKALISKVE